ncbi:MAG: aldo/keto reductase [Cyclobacteriaceae bacterium]|nr:aldo/keto reductase [Cyclobacteriaceae bacterium]
MILQESFTLSNGVQIPKLGLGTWEISDDNVAEAIRGAIKIGYRHIDSAQGYGNESGVGNGIRACGVKRESLFVTTKLDGDVKSYKAAIASIDQSLKKLALDYIDMMLIHTPKPWGKFQGNDQYFEENRETWKALEEAYKAGKLRAIGISNFKESDIDNILASCSVKPMVNQILAHISNTPVGLIQYSQEKGILVEAYSPMGHGELMKNQQVAAVAKRYDVSVPQLGIRYCLQLGTLPLPKTANPKHMKMNAEVDFVISESDMEILKNIEQIKDYGEFSMFPVFGGK